MDNAQAYIRTWQLILTHMLGWSAARAREWAKRWEPQLYDQESDLFYHEAPEYYVAGLFIPRDLTAPTPQYFLLVGKVMRAIGDPPLDGPYDWEAARQES